jgi:hypothetical protein
LLYFFTEACGLLTLELKTKLKICSEISFLRLVVFYLSWLVGWLVGWLIGWLVGWLICLIV